MVLRQPLGGGGGRIVETSGMFLTTGKKRYDNQVLIEA